MKFILQMKSTVGLLIGLILLVSMKIAAAYNGETIVIFPNTVISHSKSYINERLDLTRGTFIIRNGATLTIDNCIINGKLSKGHPIVISVENGFLRMNNNTVKIESVNIAPHPLTQSFSNMILVGIGKVSLKGNSFKIDKPYTAGLLLTSANIPTSDFEITDNKFSNFHGVLYLINSHHALIAENTFFRNSFGNIVNIGDNTHIIHNTIFFAGNDRLGNSIDIIDSSNITIRKNILFTPTCHGIYMLNSRNITVDNNHVTGGITYGIYVITYPEGMLKAPAYIQPLVSNHKFVNPISTNISVTNNYLAQNRYGFAASDVDTLTVANNIFIQYFPDRESRRFWTDNAVLLKNVLHLTWTNNLYKEAFSQENPGDNSHSNFFVPFPVTGGVIL